MGGHCIPCDPHYLLWQLRAERTEAPVIDAAMRAIAGRPRKVTERAERLLAQAGRALPGARVLVLGVAYKPGVADVRESPALEIIERLVRAGADVSYADGLVESVAVDGAAVPRSHHPEWQDWDLVLVHTLHPGVPTAWLADVPVVLDATYRLDDATGCQTV